MVKTELGDTCFSACLEEEQTQQTFYADNSGYIEVNCHVPICTEDRVRIKISETLMFKVFKDSTDRTVWIIGGIVEGSLDEWIITFPDSP